MLSTIDSNPELFSFWGEIRKGQEMVQGLKAQVDALLLLHEYQPQDKRIIQRLAKRSDQIQEAFAHALEQKETILQRLLFVRVFLPQLDQMGIHALIEAMGKALWWGAIPQPEPITKVTAKRHSDELEVVLQAFRVVQGFEVAQAPIDQEPTPTAPIVSPTATESAPAPASAPATESADPKPTEPERKPLGPMGELQGEKWRFEKGEVTVAPRVQEILKAYLDGQETFDELDDNSKPNKLASALAQTIKEARGLGFKPHPNRWPRSSNRKGMDKQILFNKVEGENSRNCQQAKTPENPGEILVLTEED
jgi:hypothetical protein